MLYQDETNHLDKIVNARVALSAAEDELVRAEDDLDYVPQWQRFQDAKAQRKLAKKALERAIGDAVNAVQGVMELPEGSTTLSSGTRSVTLNAEQIHDAVQALDSMGARLTTGS